MNIKKSKIKFINSVQNYAVGFTLIELLVSLTLLVLVSSFTVSIIWISVRNVTKINNIHSIRQNGNFAISQISKSLQFARQFDGVSTDNVNYSKTCDLPTSTPLQNYKYVKITTFENSQITYMCLSNPQTVASNSASLIDTNTYSLSNCNFTCTQSDPDSPYSIGVSFTIMKKNVVTFIEDPSPLPFGTTVTMRNL